MTVRETAVRWSNRTHHAPRDGDHRRDRMARSVMGTGKLRGSRLDWVDSIRAPTPEATVQPAQRQRGGEHEKQGRVWHRQYVLLASWHRISRVQVSKARTRLIESKSSLLQPVASEKGHAHPRFS